MAARAIGFCLLGAAGLAEGARTRAQRGSGAGAGAGHRRLRASRGHMQPEVVAQLLVRVEDEWKTEAMNYVQCNASNGAADAGNCSAPAMAFAQSCESLTHAMVKGSSGDRAKVVDYLRLICDQPLLQGWKLQHCQSFATAVTGAMTADSYYNRQRLDVAVPCNGLWPSFVEASKQEHDEFVKQAQAEAAAAEKRRQEEAKKAAEEAAAELLRKQEAAQKAAEEEALAEKRREEILASAAKQAKDEAEEAAEPKAEQEEVGQAASAAKEPMENAQASAAGLHQQESNASDTTDGNASVAVPANVTVAAPANATAAVPANATAAGHANTTAAGPANATAALPANATAAVLTGAATPTVAQSANATSNASSASK